MTAIKADSKGFIEMLQDGCECVEREANHQEAMEKEANHWEM